MAATINNTITFQTDQTTVPEYWRVPYRDQTKVGERKEETVALKTLSKRQLQEGLLCWRKIKKNRKIDDPTLCSRIVIMRG